MSCTYAQELRECRFESTVAAMKRLERKVDHLRQLHGEQLLRSGVEVLAAVLELAEGLSGLCYEIRGLIGLEADPDSEKLQTSAKSQIAAGLPAPGPRSGGAIATPGIEGGRDAG